MHAKILLLPGSNRGEKLCNLAEEILVEVSAAFGHSFSLLREKIGYPAVTAHGTPLPDRTIDACRSAGGVLVCDGECPGVQDLYDALNLPLQIRDFSIPEGLCGRHEAPVSLQVGMVLSLDEETLPRAIQCAFRFAQDKEGKISHVAPNGSAKAEWEANVRVEAVHYPAVSASAMTAPEAITALISTPNRLGLMLCPPYAGGMLNAAAGALCAHAFMVHETALDEKTGVYSPILPQRSEADLPFACALAIADLLRFSLHLGREAACVEAAVNNVLSAHPGHDGTDPDALTSLICTQIAVAGELMGRSGIR